MDLVFGTLAVVLVAEASFALDEEVGTRLVGGTPLGFHIDPEGVLEWVLSVERLLGFGVDPLGFHIDPEVDLSVEQLLVSGADKAHSSEVAWVDRRVLPVVLDIGFVACFDQEEVRIGLHDFGCLVACFG